MSEALHGRLILEISGVFLADRRPGVADSRGEVDGCIMRDGRRGIDPGPKRCGYLIEGRERLVVVLP